MATSTNLLANEIELGSERDTSSFLVPCYGFDNMEVGADYADRQDAIRGKFFKYNPQFQRDDEFAPFYRSRAYYVPRTGQNRVKFRTTELMDNILYRRPDKPIWQMLRKKTAPMPSGAYNVALMVSGRRRFHLPYQDLSNAPKWWRRLSTGERDCFAIWRRTDGSVFHQSEIGSAHSTRIYAARAARGVLYARTTNFDTKGNPADYQVKIICLEFNFVDRNPAKDDMLKVCVIAKYNHHGEPDLSDVDDEWQTLISIARLGFTSSCQTVPPEIESWRIHFFEQKARADLERSVYIRDIRNITWQQALDLVKEPWLLQLVIEAHCNACFDETPNRYDPTGTRVRRMLDAYDCTPERRAQLNQMITDYVEPADELWNHTGD